MAEHAHADLAGHDGDDAHLLPSIATEGSAPDAAPPSEVAPPGTAQDTSNDAAPAAQATLLATTVAPRTAPTAAGGAPAQGPPGGPPGTAGTGGTTLAGRPTGTAPKDVAGATEDSPSGASPAPDEFRVRLELDAQDWSALRARIPPEFVFGGAALHGKVRAEALFSGQRAKEVIIDLSSALATTCAHNALAFPPLRPADYDATLRCSHDAKGAWAAEIAMVAANWIATASLDHSVVPTGLCILPRSPASHAALILFLQHRGVVIREGGPASFRGGLSVATLRLSGDPELWAQAQVDWMGEVQTAVGSSTWATANKQHTYVTAYVPSAAAVALAHWPKRFAGHKAEVAQWRPQGGGWKPAGGRGISGKGWSKRPTGRGGRS